MENQTEVPPLACCSLKSKLMCVSAGLIVLIIVAIASFVLGRALPRGPEGTLRGTPTTAILPTPTPTPDETANWKTYTNEKYQFSIKYPSDWGEGNDLFLDKTNRVWRMVHMASTKDRAYVSGPPETRLGKGAELSIEVLATAESGGVLGAEVLLSDERAKVIKNFSILDSVPAIRSTFSHPKWLDTYTEVDFIKNRLLYRLTWHYAEEYKERFRENPESIFDQILSTFKFLD
ncbi:hypothetical protein COT65_01365 [Candidatus Shapirobacteria bacterium CG09_land_8_20_14_0_10_47_13]|uniref:PsbP C-terminal domain-containing protein n=1 Tax=Candidatus Shapirobacteria bacterium CG09_land_8_20_14_0_10_47_13 TaxID=1974481 RepID=A0A2H0WPY5_9BACT|nr:MAG: hypothetical protein COT65_01365 [Candidatus Shapirobacteria bacterium CG09_land_8_20_14_0_10_47_13]